MPVQRTLFGRPVNIVAPPRRFQFLFIVVLLFFATIFILGLPTSVGELSEIEERLEEKIEEKLEGKFPIFKHPAHKPTPDVKNSSSGDTRWFSDWNWKSPFSSTITFDENLSILPPLKKRPPIYTFYDGDAKKDKAVIKAEQKLLLIWRRAWWAQGFTPLVLGRPEAMHNPLYEPMQKLGLREGLESEILKWLAWGNMGTGILADSMAFPMADYNNPGLTYLRRGEFPLVTRFENLGNGVFAGEKNSINAAIKEILRVPSIKDKTSLLELLDGMKTTTYEATGIAYYTRKAISANYKPVFVKFEEKNDAEALSLLGQLINSHLHNRWQETFSSGVAVLKGKDHMTVLVEPAVDIARNLTQCSRSPAPSSCPPNHSKCYTCRPLWERSLRYMTEYKNDTSLYTIGTVPHPYTYTSLYYQTDEVNARFLRREVKTHDPWLKAITKSQFENHVSGASRSVRFKEIVASLFGEVGSLWLTAERETHADLDWIFGFVLPRHSDEKDDRRPGPPRGNKVSDEDLGKERDLIIKARGAVKVRNKVLARGRDAAEAWNLADTEAWRFARAYSARRRQERRKWEEQESAFAGAERDEDSGLRWRNWGRWFDKNKRMLGA